jgi:membrane protease YdiL (CAAX protease family)
VAWILALAGVGPFDRHGQLSPTYVFSLSLLDATLLIGLVFGFLAARGERPGQVLLGGHRPGREFLLGLLLVPVVFGVALSVLATVSVVAPWLHNVSRNPLEGLIRSPRDAWLFAVVTVVSGGFREEIQRGFVLHRFEQHLGGGALGVVIFSAVFGAGHVIQGWDAVLTTAALGAFWGVLYLVRRSIGASVVSHAGFDVAQILRYTQ